MLLRATFKPLSPFKYFPESFTLFGAICWGIRILYGEEELENMLSEFMGSPPFIVSSPILIKENQMFFPKPILKQGWGDVSSAEEYKNRKEAKKLKYISETALKKVLDGEVRTEKELWDFVKGEKDKNKSRIETVAVPHASINRITWTTEGGELYNEESTYISGKFAVLIKFYDVSYEEKVKASLRFVQLGGNKSTGMGACEVEFTEERGWINQYLEPTQKGFITLSPLLYEETLDLGKSYYDVFTFMAPIDNYYATVSPAIWKKKFMFISKGSYLAVKEPRNFHGCVKEALVNNQSSKKVYQYGFAFPLFTRWSYED